MAFSVNFGDKYSVLIFILLCTETHIFASKEDVYNVEGGSLHKFDDIVVVDQTEEFHRERRQVTPPAATTPSPVKTSAKTPVPAKTTPAIKVPPTVRPDLSEFNYMHDDHKYYKTSMFFATNIDEFWIELKDVKGHLTLSNSHRTAVTARLPFKFPFYGHFIDNVTIATGGFLYMSPFLHQWLTATQYIAPLMANFDTTLGNTSEIFYATIGSKFVVEWRDVHLQDQNASGSFRFQAILHQNGSITFAYRQIPMKIADISEENHSVKVGLSDAFYVDKMSPSGTRRRTIYEYHRVTLNTTYIQEGTIVMINPQPTCNRYTDCESCVTSNINFECRWCGIINKCSDSVDWHRQEWLDAGCLHLSHESLDLCKQTTTTPVQTTITQVQTTTTDLLCRHGSGKSNCSTIPTAPPKAAEKKKDGMGTQIGIIVVVVVIVVALIGSVVGWVYYAYTHPTSASGMWLMEHRPSQMKAKMSNMKFWKRNGAAGDKYAVESTA